MASLLDERLAQDVISNVDNFMFDCDGVLWDGNGAIEGSLDTILKLKKLGKRVFYVTNNSSSSRQDYVEKCKKLGFPAQLDEIVCTAYIAAQYLKKANFKDKVYLVGRADALGTELDLVGIRHIGAGPDPILSVDVKDWLVTDLDPEVGAVVVGFDPYISYPKILKAASYLRNPDCLFVATNEDRCLPTKGEVVVPGTGCVVAPIKLACNRTPTVVGKPSSDMFDILQEVHTLDKTRTIMVGDSLNTDIVFAKLCGLRSLLVLSGNASLKDTKGLPADKMPDVYAPCLADLGKLI